MWSCVKREDDQGRRWMRAAQVRATIAIGSRSASSGSLGVRNGANLPAGWWMGLWNNVKRDNEEVRVFRHVRVVVLSAAALGLVGTAVAAAAGNLPEGALRMAPAPAPTPPPLPMVTQPPLFLPTGGPYIGEQAALLRAAEIATSPVLKQDVRFMRYRDVVAYTGNRTLTIDLDREVYFVVTTGTFVGRRGDRGDVVCPAYIAVLDATTGVGLSVVCVNTPWPTKLPMAFN